MGMIRAEKLVFEYDKRDEEGNVIGSHRAIDGVDIDVPQGSFVAILGHNGSVLYNEKVRVEIIVELRKGQTEDESSYFIIRYRGI